jgi:hypothetical protein
VRDAVPVAEEKNIHMTLSDSSPKLLAASQAELEKLLDEFERSPSRATFFDIGATAEILSLDRRPEGPTPLVAMLSNAAARWLWSGILEEVAFAYAGCVYHTALLCYFAQYSDKYHPSDIKTIKRLSEGRLLGRSDLPLLSREVTAAYLSRCQVSATFGVSGKRDLATFIDKRVLRACSDEYDIMTLIMCAQLLQLGCASYESRVRLFPRTLLIESVRSDNINWLSVLTFLCVRMFGLPPWLRSAVIERAITHLPEGVGLLQWPQSDKESDIFQRTAHGLRLRSTIALMLCLNDLGEF